MFDLDLEEAIYVVGVLIFAAVFTSQFWRWRQLRKELKETRKDLAELRNMDFVMRDVAGGDEPAGTDHWGYWVVARCVLYAVIMFGMWFGARAGMQWFATADAVDAYENAKRQGDIDAACSYAGSAALAFRSVKDEGGYAHWREIERKTCAE